MLVSREHAARAAGQQSSPATIRMGTAGGGPSRTPA